MFYDSLEKTAKRKKRTRQKRQQPQQPTLLSGGDFASGAGTTLGAGALGAFGSMAAGQKMMSEIKKDKGSKAYEKLKAAMGATTSGEEFDYPGLKMEGGALTAKDGKKFFFTEDAGTALGDSRYNANAFFGDAPTKKYQRGIIGMGKDMHDADVLLHELGHGTGLGRKLQRNKAAKVLYGLSRSAAPVSLATNIGAGALASSAKTEKELERAESMNRLAGGVSAFHAMPTLMEEARASIRAQGLAKKFNHKLNKGKLLGAYGTYMGALAPALAPYAINKAIIHHKRKKLEKKASPDIGVRAHMTDTLKLLSRKRKGNLSNLEAKMLSKKLRQTALGGAAGATTLGGMLAYENKQRKK